MLSPGKIKIAGEFVEWLRQSIHGQHLSATNRVRASGSCFAVARDHHHAIVFLIENNLYASSLALLRIEFEAYIRGTWLHRCASDAQIEQFIKNTEPPKINALLSDVEKLPEYSSRRLSCLKNKHWDSLCAYTHTGGLQIQRWNTEDGIEPHYSSEEIEEVLAFSGIIGALSVMGIAGLGDNVKLAEAISDKLAQL